MKPQIPYYRAIYELAQTAIMMEDNPKEAEKRLKVLSKNKKVPQIAVMAAFEQIQGGLKAKTMSADVAIKQLDKLRFQWRGDELEYKITRLLGQLF